MKKATAKSVLAANVRKLLERNGLTKLAFSEAVGLSRPALNDLLEAERSVGIETVEKIASYFQLETWELLIDYEAGKHTPIGEKPHEKIALIASELRELGVKIRGIPEDVLEMLVRQDEDVYEAIRAMMQPLVLSSKKEEEE